MSIKTKTVDSKGRLTLGLRFANQTVIVDDSDPKRIVVKPIHRREAWLFENEEALNLLRAGLEEARGQVPKKAAQRTLAACTMTSD